MNDRFKFRVWNNKMQKFHIVFSMHGIVNDTLEGYAKDDNFVLEQCTGLKDKNGKLIYEGDILTDGANTFIVNWYDDMALFRLLYKNDNRETYCLFYPDDATSKYTVIGNIHEETEK